MDFSFTLVEGKSIENFSIHQAYNKTMWGDNLIRNYIFPLFLPGVTVLQSNDLVERFVLIFYIYTVSVFLYSLCSPAPYGRYTNAKYGWLVPSKPAWIVQESPAVFVPLLLINSVTGPGWSSGINQILVYCFMLHYIQRSFVFPLFIRGGKPTPLSASVSAFIFCSYNGFMQTYYFLTCHRYPHSWLFQWNFVLGICMFFAGMAVNIHSDRILRNLRAPGETGYKIPKGGVFNYVSGANYTGEIVEWWGFALAAWNAPAVAFAVFTSCFLGIRAWWHHQYYLQKFGSNYPKERKIVIPYVF